MVLTADTLKGPKTLIRREPSATASLPFGVKLNLRTARVQLPERHPDVCWLVYTIPPPHARWKLWSLQHTLLKLVTLILSDFLLPHASAERSQRPPTCPSLREAPSDGHSKSAVVGLGAALVRPSSESLSR
jgi:hypothetical protein